MTLDEGYNQSEICRVSKISSTCNVRRNCTHRTDMWLYVPFKSLETNGSLPPVVPSRGYSVNDKADL